MNHRPRIHCVALIVALACLTACASKKRVASEVGDNAGSTPVAVAQAAAADTYYEEVEKDGRYYVFGQEETYQTWKRTHHLPYTRTDIGGGPGGKTVVYEVDKDWPELTDWLEERFAWEHSTGAAPFFETLEHDGRIYVFGNEKTYEAFKKTHHLPYTRTRVGGGPGGKTVVFEIDKKDAGMADRLEAEFARR